MQIKQYSYHGKYAYLNIENGKIAIFDIEKDLKSIKEEKEFLKPKITVQSIDKYKVFTIGFNISSKCNLNCKYCFQSHDDNDISISTEEIEKQIIILANLIF